MPPSVARRAPGRCSKARARGPAAGRAGPRPSAGCTDDACDATNTNTTQQERSQERSMDVTDQGATIWLTGLPSAGKTTIAYALAERLRGEGHRVEVLDGDEIREFLCAGLCFTAEDRHTNVQRIGFVAELLASNGVKALVPVIAPFADSRG